MNSYERYILTSIIGKDLWNYSKLPLVLLVAILISAILVLNTTHHIRWLIVEREQIMLEKNTLDIEWRNLIIEENMLGDNRVVERIAIEKLKMQHVNPLEDNVLIQP
ncbi:cell division protein FtsL [Candidatus Curculioniphilus buchneri]|uniref:cell division protein FtsL n=1 Tax=Candidatus Curculioniphilus buchneri TaxID=690594 RepID=UPI00376EA4B6